MIIFRGDKYPIKKEKYTFMRKIIDRKTAYRAVLLILALIAVLSVFPLRIWTSVFETSAGGTRTEERAVNFENEYKQKFVARYDRLSSVDIYVSKVELGSYMEVSITDAAHPEWEEALIRTLPDLEETNLPGYVRVPLEFNLEVGKEYVLNVKGCRSKFYINLEDVPAGSEYVGSMYLNDEEIPGRHIAAGYNYRVPVSKKISFCVILAVAVLTAALYCFIGLYFSKRPESNSLVTVEKCIKYTANPIAAVVYLALMIMVFPLKMFDTRVLDIVFYEIGLIIAAGITFYAINHKSVKSEVGISYADKVDAAEKVRYFFMTFSMAMVIWYSCEYMNGLYDIFHYLSERKMVIWLLILLLLTFTAKEAFNAFNLLWLIASTIGGFCYYRTHLVPDTEIEFDLKNAALKYAIIVIVLSGFLVINLIKLLFTYIQEKANKNIRVNENRAKVSAYGIFVYVFLASLIITRNDRWWGIVMTAVFGCLYIRGLVWKGRKDWLYILSGGLMLNFVISLCYCLLFRCFAGYTSGRFGFVFHTVTVAGQYFIVMGVAVTVLLTAKIVAFPKGTGVKEIIKNSWKEMVLFGWIASYAVFTVTRTAYIALFLCLFGVLIVVLICYGSKFGKILLTMILSVVVCFPAAFTLQRMVPTMVGNPAIIKDPANGRDIEDIDPFIKGGAAWDSSNYMCVERFVNLFESKILGIDVGDYDYPSDIKNYDPETWEPILDDYGYPVEEDAEDTGSTGRIDFEEAENLLASSRFTRAEALMLLDALDEHVDQTNKWDVVLNGRVTIWKLYMNNLNMAGHPEPLCWPGTNTIVLHAHSSYLELAYQNGIPVGILFTLFILGSVVYGIIYYRKNEKKQPLALLPFAIACGTMIAAMTEHVFYLSYVMTPVIMFAIFPLMQDNK